MKEEQLFHQVLELAADQRAAYLDAVCGADVELRGRVESLLRAQANPGSFLQSPAFGVDQSPTIDQSPFERPGTQIGPYKLLQQIGEGGMGTVFMAEQHEPVKRRVALKVIKLGMDTRQVIARFEAERQALTLMDHPNIAKVLDAGTTDSGRPYFVMELVKGQPITQYCDEHRLTPRQRLELLIPVCQAIQHAHQKGIIHRDIKPTNILVAEYDEQPVPKVIDFGVAKATSQTLTEKTMFTGLGQIVGTLEYMSPEQAKVNQLDIDTRSDIYSLGVLLYELLTGSTPFNRKRLQSAAFDEMLRIIREEEPPKPSTRLSDSHDSLPSISAQRHTEPVKLTRLVRGELDWIVMKALEKDRGRRYETANGFASDIQRYLSDEPVQACPPSAAYRVRKFMKRNRAQVIAGGIVAGAMVLGLIGTSIGLAWALTEKTKAKRAAESEAAAKVSAQENEQKAIASTKAAEDAKEEEAKARKRAETITVFVTTALKSSDAQNAGFAGAGADAGHDMTILAAMEIAVKDIDSGRFKDDPETEAELRDTIGTILYNNGHYDNAKPLLEQSLAMRERLFKSEDPIVAASLNNLGAIYEAQGQYAQAELLGTRALAIEEKALGPDHPEVARSLCNLAVVYAAQGKYAQAEPLYTRALAIREKALGPDHPDVAHNLFKLAGFYWSRGRYAQSEPLFARALAIKEKAFGPDHPDVAGILNDLALLYRAQDRYAEAEPLFMRALEIREKALAPDHPHVLKTKGNIASLYWSQGKLDESIPLFEEVFKAREAKLGRQHPDTLHGMANLGVNYKDAGRIAEAIPLLEEAYRASKPHPELFFAGPTLLDAYSKAVDPDKPESTARVVVLVQELITTGRATLPKDSPELAAKLAALSVTLVALKAWDEAEPMLREALTIREAKEPGDWRTFNTKSMLGGTLLGQNKLAEAEPLLLDGYRGMKEREAAIPAAGKVRIPEALERLVRLYEAKGNEPEAAAWRSMLEAARAE